jgi:hypothetical protein
VYNGEYISSATDMDNPLQGFTEWNLTRSGPREKLEPQKTSASVYVFDFRKIIAATMTAPDSE